MRTRNLLDGWKWKEINDAMDGLGFALICGHSNLTAHIHCSQAGYLNLNSAQALCWMVFSLAPAFLILIFVLIPLMTHPASTWPAFGLPFSTYVRRLSLQPASAWSTYLLLSEFVPLCPPVADRSLSLTLVLPMTWCLLVRLSLDQA